MFETVISHIYQKERKICEMADNKKMQQAKADKNDEFYTEYSTISDEMGHYREQFEGKTVYCNCDDPTWSNFWKYFHNNFGSLKLKKLISTHYQKDTEPSYAMIYEGGDDFNLDAGKIVEIEGNTAGSDNEVFYSAGDFRSDDCLKLMEESDIIVTNPPFSLFRVYIEVLVASGKRFLVIGNMNAIAYKEVFPLIKNNKVWLGYNSGNMRFRVPDDYSSSSTVIENGVKYAKFGNTCWFTNLDAKYRHDGLWHRNGKFDNTQAHCYYEGNEDFYPKYDNYNAIEIAKIKYIPIDYDGVMGVPISLLDKYNPDEFEIIGYSEAGNPLCFKFYKDMHLVQPLNGGDKPNSKSAWYAPMIPIIPTDNENYYTASNSFHKLKKVFTRIFIRNLHPVKKADDLGY